jgi:AraC family transcriptional regulator
MSPFHFVRAFKASFGKSPYQYLTQLRMAHALTLLQTTAASLSEVAASVGYSGTTHFSAQFRRAWGSAPLDARAERRAPGERRDAA